MKASPAGWPRISPSVFYEDPAKAIDWLCRAFGFTVRLKVEGESGRIEHSELEFGEGVIMVGGAGAAYVREDKTWRERAGSPAALGGKNTQSLCVQVENADDHCVRARAAGAIVFYEPTNTDYGPEYWEDRNYGALDLEGHMWWFIERVRNPGPAAK